MPTAVVTGANSGIGNAFAKLLLDEGYKVYAGDVKVGDGLNALKGDVQVGELDVTSPDSISRFQSKIGDEHVDVLLNIAGIAFASEKDSIQTTNLEMLQKVFAVNAYGPLLVTQALLPNILKSKAPKIGILTSRVGSVGDNSSGGMYAYRSSKAAANQVARTFAMDLKDKGVVVTVLHPGFVRSGLLPGSDGPEFVDPEEAATKLWKNIVSQKTIEDTGKFWHREGQELICLTKTIHHDTYPSISPERPDLSAEGKVVLITGAGTGIGQATALAFAKAKAKVIILYGRRSQKLEETKGKIQALGVDTGFIVQILDVTSQDSVDIVFETVHNQAGPIDIVVSSTGHLSEPGTIRHTSVENFWDSFEVNVKGSFIAGRAFLRHCPNVIAPASYALSKLALAKLAEYLASENPDGLRAYALQPGVLLSEMNVRSLRMAPEGTREKIPWDTPELPAHFMLWLASKSGASVPSGRFLWVNRDVDELEAHNQEMKDDLYLCSMRMGGWPHNGKVRGVPLS